MTSLTRMQKLSWMKLHFSVYEAKAKLSQILRLVKQGKRVTITERGRGVAHVVPLQEEEGLEHRIADLVVAGVLSPRPAVRPGDVKPGVHRPGALARFLQERD